MYNSHKRTELLTIARQIQDLEEEAGVLKEDLAGLLSEFRKECDHETVVQAELWQTDRRCIRICTICSLEENGWYDEMGAPRGHTLLKDPSQASPSARVIHTIPRDQLLKYRTLQPFAFVNPDPEDRVAEVMGKALEHSQRELQNYKHLPAKE